MSYGIYADYRLGGIPEYYIGEERLALIPDEMRKCTALGYYQATKEKMGIGTVFFVSYQSKPESLSGFPVYAITAKHVTEGAGESLDHKFRLRFNLNNGSTGEYTTKPEDWLTHPSDNSVDVAVLPLPVLKDIDFRFLPTFSFASKEVIQKLEIGLGEEIFMIGVFKYHLGKKNIPIVRVGSLVAMPEEPIQTRKYGPMEAYLIESRSLGGLSGSPVFVYRNPLRGEIGKPTSLQLGMPPACFLLGLMHGHYKREVKEDSNVGLFEPDEELNTGIAIVVPADKIMEVLDQPRLKEVRRKTEEEAKAKNSLVLD